jgi:hypothetical protein
VTEMGSATFHRQRRLVAEQLETMGVKISQLRHGVRAGS